MRSFKAHHDFILYRTRTIRVQIDLYFKGEWDALLLWKSNTI